MFQITNLFVFSLVGNAQGSYLAHFWRMEKHSEIKPPLSFNYCNITQIPNEAFLTFCVILCHLDMARLGSQIVNPETPEPTKFLVGKSEIWSMKCIVSFCPLF